MEAITVVKAAAVAIKNRDKIGKIAGIIAVIALLPVIVIIVCFLGIMSAFAPDGVLKSSEYFDGADSAIYQSIKCVTDPFYEQIEEQMKEMKEDIIEEYTYEYEITDENGKKQKVKDEPEVTQKINYIPENIIIAYLMQIEAIDTKTAVIDEGALTSFLNAICTIEQIDQGNNCFLLENKVLTIGEISDMYFTTEMDKTRYKITCEAYADYFDVAESKVIENGNVRVDGIFTANQSSVPLYLQYDTAWSGVAYGDGTIRNKGCCPTCLAMVFSYLRGESIYPSDIVAWSGNTYYVNGAGTSWSIFSPAAAQWGVKCTSIGKNAESMQEALSGGKLIIASMGPGTFTKGGHFIVLTGITEDGKIWVNDPNDNGTKQHINKAFEMSLILRESKNMWVFE